MAAKSVLKSSASAVLAALMAMGLFQPTALSAQEDRGQGGMRRMERMERQRGISIPAPARSAPPAMRAMSRQMDQATPGTTPAPQRQAGAWQGQAWQGQARQGQEWQGRRQASAASPGWSGNRPPRGPRRDSQIAGQIAGQPGFGGGRPLWRQDIRGGSFGRPGDAAVASTNSTTINPAWSGRNPTYVDPRRNSGNGAGTGQQGWDQNRTGNRNRDGKRNWNRNGDRNWLPNGEWNRGRDWNRSRDWNRGRDWDRGRWRRDNRYDWLSWRNSHRDFFRGGFYSAPFGGYSYSRLSIGLFLGNAFFDQRYWIADPWAYHLPPAYQPYQWVRYYNDVVLVDTYTGEVVDVIHDFFW